MAELTDKQKTLADLTIIEFALQRIDDYLYSENTGATMEPVIREAMGAVEKIRARILP